MNEEKCPICKKDQTETTGEYVCGSKYGLNDEEEMHFLQSAECEENRTSLKNKKGK